MKYRHTDDDRFAVFENMMVDICARLREPDSENTNIMHSKAHKDAYQQMVRGAVQNMPLLQGGPAFSYTEIPDTTKMHHEGAYGQIHYNKLISDLLWRAELYRRGETFESHTKGICDISWRILAATGAALSEFEEGSDLATFIDGIDLPTSIRRGDQAGRTDVLRVLELQHAYGGESQEYQVTNPYPNDIEQVLCTSEYGRVVAQAGLVNEECHLVMRIEDGHFTLYQGVSTVAGQGMTGKPFKRLIEHPLFHGLDLVVRDVETQPDRMVVQLEGVQMKNLKWEEKKNDDGIQQ